MKSIFEKSVRDEIIIRIGSLQADSKPHWGKMNVTQMVKHCCLCEEYYFGNIFIRRSVAGRIFGKIAIRGILKNEDSALKKNAPTSPQFIVTENIDDLENEKLKWKSLIERYTSFNKKEFTHWFFGTMTKEELGQFIYKHCDHHLRQFGA